VHKPVSPCDDCKLIQRDQYVGASDNTTCYHYNTVDDLELGKNQERSTEIMKMTNVDMAEHLKSAMINLLDVADFDQGRTNIQSIKYDPPNQEVFSKY
jgi:hypothetical protein